MMADEHIHTHDHEHDHEKENHEYITLVDENGNEELYEILMTIDGQEEFGKNYVLVYPASTDEDSDEEIEVGAYAYIENEDGSEGELMEIETDAEWDFVEGVFSAFAEEEEE